ncbi:hypothetical protein V8C34DRAFT_299748 [Trichoderma compactum]
MANKVPPSLKDIKNTTTEFLHSLQRYPESDILTFLQKESVVEVFLNLLLPFFQIALEVRAKFGKELQWCKELQTIAASERISLESTGTHPTPIVYDDTSSTQQTLIAEEHSNPNDVSGTDVTSTDTEEHSSFDTEDATTVNEHSSSNNGEENSSTTAKEHSGSHDIPGNSSANTEQNTVHDAEDEILKNFISLASSFPKWMSDPTSFWDHSIQALQLAGHTVNERTVAFLHHAVREQSDGEIHTFQRRFDSVIAYHTYKREISSGHISSANIKKFFQIIRASPVKETKDYELLFSGKRRLEFCSRLTRDKIDLDSTALYVYDNIGFADIDYSPLFLGLHDKIWEIKTARWRQRADRAVDRLISENFSALSEKHRARLVASILLAFREASICHTTRIPAMSGARANDITLAVLSTEKDNTTTTPSNSGDGLDSTRASKRSRTGEDLDGTRASKRSCAVANLKTTVAPEYACTGGALDMRVQAAEATGQRSTAPEATVANLACGLNTMPLDLPPDSETNNSIPNQDYTPLVDINVPNSGYGFDSGELNTPLPNSISQLGYGFDNGELNVFNIPLPKNISQFGYGFNNGELNVFNTRLPNYIPQLGYGFNNGELNVFDISLPNYIPQLHSGFNTPLPNNNPQLDNGFTNQEPNVLDAPLPDINEQDFSNAWLAGDERALQFPHAKPVAAEESRPV